MVVSPSGPDRVARQSCNKHKAELASPMMMRVWQAPGGNRTQWERSRHCFHRDRVGSTPRRAAHSERLPPTTQCSAGPPTSCSMDMHAATQRSVAAARQLGSAVRAATAARRCRLPLPSGGAPRPGGMEQQRAAARLGRLLSSLTPRASSGQESVGAPAAAPPPSAAQAAAAAAAPAPPPLASGYRLPPKEIADIVDAPPEPLLSFSPDRTLVLQARRRCLLGPPAALRLHASTFSGMPLCPATTPNASSLHPEASLCVLRHPLQLSRPPSNPPISELARPELKLAGASWRCSKGLLGRGTLRWDAVRLSSRQYRNPKCSLGCRAEGVTGTQWLQRVWWVVSVVN